MLDPEPAGLSPKIARAQNSLNDLSLECLDAEFAAPTTSSNGSDTTAAPGGPSSCTSPRALAHQQMRRAEGLAALGRSAEALELLKPLLARRPQDPDALCLQGACLVAAGSRATALASFAGALAGDPCHLRALLGCAGLHKDSGMLPEALGFLEKAHAIACGRDDDDDDDGAAPAPADRQASCCSSPSDVSTADTAGDRGSEDGGSGGAGGGAVSEAAALRDQVCRALAMVLTDMGTQNKLAGRPGWEALYDRAVGVAPAYAPAHYNLGVAAAEGGDGTGALARYRRAVELEPRYAEAWCNMGVILKGRGRLGEAIAAYESALAAAPHLEMVQTNLASALTEHGTALKAGGDLAGGVRAYERAVALRPRHAEALYNLGVAHTEAGELDRAVFFYEMAVAAAPGCAEAHNNLGVLHRERGNLEAAVRCYEAALAARPNFPQGLNNLAVILTQQGRAGEAGNLLHAALLAKPDYAEAHNNLGVLQRDVGDAAAAVASYARACELDPANRNAGQNRLLALNYVHPGESDLVCDAHAAWGEAFQRGHPRLPPRRRAEVAPGAGTSRPLVVGYVSPDLFIHSVSYFAEAPLRHHDPARVRMIVYSCAARPDAKTERLAAAVAAAGGVWRDVARLSEEELAAAVRADGVEVLVELTGHTAGNRLGALARRPAPVQVTWIGYPNSTGLAAVDYRITDAVCDPPGSRQRYAERLVRLPGCFLCYTPAPDATPVAPPPAARNGYVTFGSFNALAKQTPEVVAAWARILSGVPGSRLVLKNKPFACAAVRERWWEFLEAAGVGRDRVDLLPLAPATRDHLAQYALVDVCLDPWPYTGTTTTAEALYMGVPVLTLAGGCHAAAVGASLLATVGLAPGWVAHSVEEYVARAREVTGDVGALATLRSGLRARMLASPLCDGPGFVRRLEDVYVGLWERWYAGGEEGDEEGEEGAGEAEEEAPAPPAP